MLITAADVAMIAKVRRPVVSMWRKRYVDADAFPEPVADGSFDADRSRQTRCCERSAE